MTNTFRWLVPAVAITVLALGFYAAPLAAQDAPATQPTTQPAGSVTVTVNDQNGKPVSGVTVSIAARRGRRGAAAAATQPAAGAPARGRGAAVASGKTDDTGVVTLSNLAPGNYTASVRTTDGQRGSSRFAVAEGEPATVTVTLGTTARGGGGGGGGGAGGGAAGGGN